MNKEINRKLSKFVDLAEAEDRDIHSLPPPRACDICAKLLKEEKYFIDGALKGSTAWANMCPECFVNNGTSIGWGDGQLYMQDKNRGWLMVAGFPPKEDEDGPACNFCGESYPKKDLLEMRGGEFSCKQCMDNAEEMMGQWIASQKDERGK